ncbi:MULTISPECIES: hypothetical protein [Hymenobacter]|uniref:Lipoprotein n=1 Tax=Hymenobacter armeniacus TaxID=2771358 RepID=A0ABR8JT78_9BACT|nr:MULTISPECIES: hypothetical protein [Hymenobacter]MBD2721996.1 hypothetical protein [Hymenobacter armeniacus]MBJ6108090.1 hypothetical protein [Hymenobacter sp. BT523]
MKLLPRLLGLGLLGLLLALVTMSCESSKTATNEFGSPNRIKGEVIAKPESRQIVHFTDSSTEYKTPRSELAKAFIRQFNDGTVIDKIQVRKAPVDAGTVATYYLIGMGLRSGTFRAMALPLTSGGDNTFYLRPSAERYTLSSTGCPACFFNFENGRIVGTSCSESSPGSHCDLKIEPNNELFANAR